MAILIFCAIVAALVVVICMMIADSTLVAWIAQKVLEPSVRIFQRTFLGIDKVTAGVETLFESKAEVVDDVVRQSDGTFAGTVRIEGEIWNAVSEREISAGSPVVVVDRSDLTLTIK